MDFKAIVLAPERGAPSHGLDAPAPASRVANRPVVWHVLKSVRAAGARETALIGSTSALADLRATLEAEGASGADLVYLPTTADRLFDRLAAAVPFVGDGPCVVHTADGLLGEPLAPLSEMLRPAHPDLVLLWHDSARPRSAWDDQALQLLKLGHITGFAGPSTLAGAALLGSGALPLACDQSRSSAPATLTSVAERLVAAGGQLQSGRVSWCSYTGDPHDLLELNRMVLDQLPPQPPGPARGGNEIEGRVVIHPTAEVRSSVIAGPAVIGARAIIENAYIGPYTSVGSDVQIEASEISRSIVLEGSRILRVRDRIEASTIGPRAVIRTDFGLPRAMRLHVGGGVELLLNN